MRALHEWMNRRAKLWTGWWPMRTDASRLYYLSEGRRSAPLTNPAPIERERRRSLKTVGRVDPEASIMLFGLWKRSRQDSNLRHQV